MKVMTSLKDTLDSFAQPAWLSEPAKESAVRCLACAHRCLIQPGKRGICQVRFNREGQLFAPSGYVAGLQLDPIEKKPFMHFLPGSAALTFGMLGCNFHCDFCQNWVSSQALRDPGSALGSSAIQPIQPAELVDLALRNKARSIISSYNEPLITSEWAMEVFTLAKQKGLRTAYVSNGFATPQALQALRPCLDAFKVDLKCLSDAGYRELGGSLSAVLESIRLAHELGLWVEVVTLVIPGFNDGNEELWQSARFLALLSPDIPWHVTAFHPAYQRTQAPATSSEMLLRAADIGQEAGLRYVYAGNLPGRVGSLEDTHCPACSKALIQRTAYNLRSNLVTPEGACPHCGQTIAGVWS